MQTNLRSGAIKLFIAFNLTLPGIALAAGPAPTATVPAAATAASAVSKPAVSGQPASAAAPAAQPAPHAKTVIRFGYLDMPRFGTDSVPGKAISARLKEKSEKYQATIVSKQKQLEKQKKAIEAKIAQLSPEQRAAKSKEFQKKIEGFQKYVQSAEKDMHNLEEQLTVKLFQAVQKAAAAYGKESGLVAVAAKKDILYLNNDVEGVDITSAIIERINKEKLKL
jgi:outer membrane protein